jgi:hypothetical protein
MSKRECPEPRFLDESSEKQSKAGTQARARRLRLYGLWNSVATSVSAVRDLPIAVWILQPQAEVGGAAPAHVRARTGAFSLWLPPRARAATAEWLGQCEARTTPISLSGISSTGDL